MKTNQFLKLATLHYGQDDSARQTTARQLLDHLAARGVAKL